MNRIEAATPDELVLEVLGRRIAAERIARDLTQEQLASQAGVSRSTIRRLEAGESTQLTNLLRILRALSLLGNLDALVPEPAERPMRVLEGLGRDGRVRDGRESRSPRRRDNVRRRASGRRRRNAPTTGRSPWGEDR